MRTIDAVLSELEYEWKDTHHNATLLGMFDQFVEFDEADFEFFLTTERELAIVEAQYRAVRIFREDLTFDFVGRSGASLVPTDWIYLDNGEWGMMSTEKMGIDGLVGAAQIARAEKCLKILKWLNTAVKNTIKSLPKLWIEFKTELVDNGD